MSAEIGFALLTHREPRQVARLVDRLRRLYGPAVPIVIHHDQSQVPLDRAAVPGAELIEPSRRTGWADWSVTAATLDVLRHLHGGPAAPAFTVLLSGADYPVAPPARVVTDLRAGGADAYLIAYPVSPWRRDVVVPGPLGLGVNVGASHQEICYRRYYSTTLRLGPLHHRIRSPLLAPLLSPFSRRLRAFAGEQWCVLGRRAVQALLESALRRPDLLRWFAERPAADEAYVHTVLGNAPGLRLAPRNFRHVDWSTRSSHPRTLGIGDVPGLAASGAHFARKFEPDDPALDALDAHLGLPRWEPEPGDLAAGADLRQPASAG